MSSATASGFFIGVAAKLLRLVFTLGTLYCGLCVLSVLCLSLSLTLSVCLSLTLSLFLFSPSLCLSFSPSLSLFLSLFLFSPSLCLSLPHSLSLSLCLSLSRSIYRGTASRWCGPAPSHDLRAARTSDSTTTTSPRSSPEPSQVYT